jgi:hypothetical protein
MAVCQRRSHGEDALTDLALQRRITSMLRVTLGALAEDIAVFILGEGRDEDLATLVAIWDADVLVSDGNIELIT